MDSYYLKRVGQAVVILWLVITISFLLYRALPGGPMQALKYRLLQEMTEAGGNPTTQQLEQVNRMVKVYTNMRPDQPLYVAYFSYLWEIIHLDFGKSILLDEPVFSAIFKKLPWSMFISIYGLALGTSTSLLFGALMAHNEGSRFDMGMTVWTIFNSSVPYYIVAILMLIAFGFKLQWFPTGGRYNHNLATGVNLPFMKSVIHHAALPILTGFVASFGGALAYRGNCIREKGKEYIRIGRLRGVSEPRLAMRYVGRNSILPIYTGLLMGITRIVSSGIIIEIIFSYDAVGLLTYNALLNRDYPLLMGALIFFTTITLCGILIADLTYGIVDPRVKSGADRETF